MTMQECYKAIGGNCEAVLGRLHSEALIQRFTFPKSCITSTGPMGGSTASNLKSAVRK